MDAAKIRLSAEEASLITRSDWILTKNNVLVKVKKLLESLQWQQTELSALIKFPGNPDQLHPKISKGENYLGLPYLVLDYPRYFLKEDVLAIRTMFWWGHFFSVTLHLAGKYREACAANLVHQFSALQHAGFYYCVHHDPWHYHYEQDNYKLLHEISQHEFTDMVERNPFIKISAKVPLDKWDDAELMLMEFYRQLLLVTRQ